MASARALRLRKRRNKRASSSREEVEIATGDRRVHAKAIYSQSHGNIAADPLRFAYISSLFQPLCTYHDGTYKASVTIAYASRDIVPTILSPRRGISTGETSKFPRRLSANFDGSIREITRPELNKQKDFSFLLVL